MYKQIITAAALATVLTGCSSTGQQPAPVTEYGQTSAVEDDLTVNSVDIANLDGPAFDEAVADLSPEQLEEVFQSLDDTIYFELASNQLSADSQITLDRYASILKNAPDRQMEIQGHCDVRGTQSFNMSLGLERAQAVKSYLQITHNIPASQLKPHSYGEELTLCDDLTEACHSQNRRAVIVKN